MIMVATYCLRLSTSPSITPQKIATMGIKYVTAEANKGDANLTNLLKSV